MRVGPAAKGQPVLVAPDPFTQLPGVFDTSRRSDVAIAAEHHQGLEAVLTGAIGVGQTVLFAVLAGQERNDVRSRHVGAEIRDEVPEIVFFAQSDRAVRQEHELALPGQVRTA